MQVPKNVEARDCDLKVYVLAAGGSHLNDRCGHLDYRVTDGRPRTIIEGHNPIALREQDGKQAKPAPSPTVVAANPSFDCARAASPVELIICGNPDLTSLDAQLGQVYEAKLSTLQGEDRKRFTEEQRRWITTRRVDCGIPAHGIPSPAFMVEKKPCLVNHTRNRIEALRKT